MMRKMIVLLAVSLGIYAFALPVGEDFRLRLVQQLLAYVGKLPQEKVYVHTDRDHYNVNEKVWLRAYLVNAVTHQESKYSRYVYVELLDRQDSIYAKVKIPYRDSVFAGYVPLSKKLPQGDYFLRAYSAWMQNAGDEYISRKKIRVINPDASKVRTEINYKENGTVAEIRFFNSRGESYIDVAIGCEQKGKSVIKRTDDRGCIQLKIDTSSYQKTVAVNFKYNEPFFFEQTLYLSDPKKDFHVDFFPEGGGLAVGCEQTVAFKALGSDGLSREVSGFIFNSKDEQIGWIQSISHGMGSFALPVVPGEHYYVVCTSSEQVQKRFELPTPDSHALVLKLFPGKDKVGYAVMAADSALIPEDLTLLVHSRGLPLVCEEVTEHPQGIIDLAKFPEGIMHFVLMDGKCNIYSQRLYFSYKENRPQIELNVNKPKYRIREGVQLNIQVLADSSVNRSGSFSVAVTDDSRCDRDTTQGNILSSLLLTSDLKGYIEEPNFYFRDNRSFTRTCMDILMMTQGWTRFEVSRIYEQKFDSLRYYMEKGQAISGKVKNFWGKDADHAKLTLLGTNGLVKFVQADSTGSFMIDGIGFPDSTQFMLSATTGKGRKTVEVIVDQEKFLPPSVKIPYGKELEKRDEAFYKKFTRDYYYDNGIKVYVLDEAVIIRSKKEKKYSFYDNLADHNLDSLALAGMADKSISELLRQLPGISVLGDSIQRYGKSISILVNEMEEVDRSFMTLLRPDDLVSVNLLLPPKSVTLFGSKAANGIILLTTNPNYVRKDLPRPNMATFSILGYQKAAEFYMPHYEIDSVRIALADSLDQRISVYWNPKVETDVAGRANCFFTTADSDGPYTVVIEGLLKNGMICRQEKKIYLGGR